ncbi:unnamed protein product [Prorocentrum cordatum]|uniref:Protein kinase domain-containing protein n=1 Tax=Prorocentrum cordatum TaxID=2364126 RepID=A0ABN9QI50_9DINO|nr:unnamed protein product [Polarella glacialis]
MVEQAADADLVGERLAAGGGAASEVAELHWDSANVLAEGSNKVIFGGSFRGVKVVVCRPRRTVEIDIWRAENEIMVLKALGPNPAIIQLIASGMIASGDNHMMPTLVLEIVQPIGFDLNRLWSQYALTGFQVPERLCGRLFLQMVGGLQHMHSRRILHLDLKTANVLVTATYDAKLCDFGMSDNIGAMKRMQCRRGEMHYMPPEMLEGMDLDAAADCWGLGVILHQTYNHGEFRLVRYSESQRRWKKRAEVPMVARAPEPIQEVMRGLIRDDPSRRMTLEEMLESEWLSRNADDFETPHEDDPWLVIPRTPHEPSKWLVPYLGGSPLLTISSFIGSQQVHLLNRTLADLKLHALTHVMLVRQPGTEDRFTNPSEDIRLKTGMHVYLGIPADSVDTDAAVEVVEEVFLPGRALSKRRSHDSACSEEELAPCPDRPSMFPACRGSLVAKYDLHDVTKAYARSKFEVAETGAIYAFAMEFDSFRFPQHIGHEATIGKEPLRGPRREFNDVGHIALNLKGAFNINLVGIQRVGEDSVEWFPDPIVQVRPGDLGIVARCPMTDGSSKPSVDEEALASLMIEERFIDVIMARRDCAHVPVEVGVVRNEMFSSVRVYKKPWDEQAGQANGA